MAANAPAIASADQPLTVSPQNGTLDASPSTQISILGRKAKQIDSVTAVGSVSGSHTGQLEGYSDSSGASFVPDTPFTPGETVAVNVQANGGRAASVSFTIGTLVPAAAIPTLNLSTPHQDTKLQHFVSRPDLLPPQISVSMQNPHETSDILLTPLPAPTVHLDGGPLLTLKPVGPGGPMLLDNQGRTLWFDQLPESPSTVAGALDTATYKKQPVLTFWEGSVKALAFGVGKGVILDRSYHTLAEVNAGNGFPMDIHEFQVDKDGNALIDSYQPIHPAGWVPGQPMLVDSIIQQIDIATGLVKWEWHAYGHIPTTDAYFPPANGSFDPFHVNAIQQQPDGNIVASMRDTSAIYKIDETTGNIIWTLGGKESTFDVGPENTPCDPTGAIPCAPPVNPNRFYFQHDVRMLSNDTVSLFDDESGPPIFAPTSRGVIMKLDFTNKTASVTSQYARPTNTLADSEGSTQKLNSGDVFVGFGSEPNFSQFSADGTMNFDAALPVDDGSYRTLRANWDGMPDTLPAAAAVRTSPTDVSIYASWNGATKVKSWRVLAGGNADSLKKVASAAWSGFETSIPVSGTATAFEVQALDSCGKVLATSAVVTAP